jgi:hypothetical protein
MPYSGTITVSGGVGPYHWGPARTGLWPNWMTATANGPTLTISGTPDFVSDGFFSPAGPVSDSGTLQQAGYWWVDITVIYPPITITCNLPAATVGQPYVGTVTATGGDGTPFTWANIPNPGGLTSSANGGTLTISGTPAVSDADLTTSPPSPGHYDISAIVTDSQTSFRKDCTLVVDP